MFKGLITTLLVVALAAGAAVATPTLTITETITAAKNLSNVNIFSQLSASQKAGLDGLPLPGIYTVSFSATISGLAPGQNWANELLMPQFSGPGITAAGGWATPANPQLDVFTTDGTSDTVMSLMNNNEVDNGYYFIYFTSAMASYVHPGQNDATPEGSTNYQSISLGSLKVKYDGTSWGSTFSVIPGIARDPYSGELQPDYPIHTMSTWDNNGTIGVSPDGMSLVGSGDPDGLTALRTTDYNFSTNAIVFGTPEPATMALLAIGGIGALLRRRK